MEILIDAGETLSQKKEGIQKVFFTTIFVFLLFEYPLQVNFPIAGYLQIA
jgi:hypothetical protein